MIISAEVYAAAVTGTAVAEVAALLALLLLALPAIGREEALPVSLVSYPVLFKRPPLSCLLYPGYICIVA